MSSEYPCGSGYSIRDLKSAITRIAEKASAEEGGRGFPEIQFGMLLAPDFIAGAFGNLPGHAPNSQLQITEIECRTKASITRTVFLIDPIVKALRQECRFPTIGLFDDRFMVVPENHQGNLRMAASFHTTRVTSDLVDTTVPSSTVPKRPP